MYFTIQLHLAAAAELNPIPETELFWFLCHIKKVKECRLAVYFIVCTLLEQKYSKVQYFSSYVGWSQKVQWVGVHRTEVQKYIMALASKCEVKTGGSSMVGILFLSLLKDSWPSFGQPPVSFVCQFSNAGSQTALRAGDAGQDKTKASTAHTENSQSSLSSEQLKGLAFSKKCSWHLSSLLSNDNVCSSFLGWIPSFYFDDSACAEAQAALRAGWGWFGTCLAQTECWCAGQQTPLLPADLSFNYSLEQWIYPQPCGFPAFYLLQFRTLRVGVCEEEEEGQVLTTLGCCEGLIL